MPVGMKLIYHPLSPFSRKVYILALELGLASQITLEKVVVAPVFYPGWSDKYVPLHHSDFSFLHIINPHAHAPLLATPTSQQPATP